MPPAQESTMVISLKAVPDMRAVGGNRQSAHWGQRHRENQAEKNKWILALLEAGMQPRDTPLYIGKVRIDVELVFPVTRGGVKDEDNVRAALKYLADCLEVHRVIPHGASWTVRGFAGIVANDRDISWGAVTITRDMKRAPLTVLTVQVY